VLEAKMFSKLSPGVKHASYFDQAARNVACIAEVLKIAKRPLSEMSFLGFYVLAPETQIEQNIFKENLERKSIQEKVERRVKEYKGEKNNWLLETFIPALNCMKIDALSWEGIIYTIRKYDPNTANELEQFYKLCLQYNKVANMGNEAQDL